jgi:hypothetical protein
MPLRSWYERLLGVKPDPSAPALDRLRWLRGVYFRNLLITVVLFAFAVAERSSLSWWLFAISAMLWWVGFCWLMSAFARERRARTRPPLTDAEAQSQRESARSALGTLTGAERWLCGPLIRRQLDRGPSVGPDVDKYGPEGAVKLCSARAIQAYMYPVAVVMVGFAVAGIGSVAGALFALVFLMGVLGITRSVGASRAGRRWRASTGLTKT